MSKRTLPSASARDEIEEALRQLSLLQNKETLVPIRASTIAQLADQFQSRKHSNAFEGATQRTVEREIQDVAKFSIRLANTLDALHAPTIQVLANAVPLANRDGAPELPNIAFIRSELPKILRALAEITKALKLKSEDFPSDRRGSKRDRLVHAVADMVARIFYDLTGEKPDRSQGPHKYKALLANVFLALTIKANVDRAAKDAVATLWPN
jgi:hypothetical protein